MVKKFALIFGIVYVLIGIMGFIPGLVTPPEATLDMPADTGYGQLLGLFAVNLWHNLVHLAIGVWGIVAAKSFGSAVFYARANTVIFGALVILGLFPVTNILFGLAPIYGHDIWLHLLNTLVAGYFGFGPPARQKAEPMHHRPQ